MAQFIGFALMFAAGGWYLRWTNGVESLWMASAICIMTCGMADGTEVSSIGETESLGCMVDLEEGDSVFA